MKHLSNTRLLALWILSVSTAGSATGATGDPVLVNEVLASHTGTDDTEYVELFGVPGTVLSGLSVIAVESDAIASRGSIDFRVDFGPTDVIGSNGFYLIGNPAGLAGRYGVLPNVAIGNDSLENSSLTLALVETATISGASVTGGEVVRDALILIDTGTSDMGFFGAPVIGPDGAFFPAGARRVADGVDTDTADDWVIADFGLGPANTPMAGDTPPPPPPIVATIMEIQGNGQFSPLQGERVETTGVVTLATANGFNFWMQDPGGDGDPATSDGIFVAGASGAAPGMLVRVVARVEEQQFGINLPLTRLTTVDEVETLATGEPLPKPIALTRLPDVDLSEGVAFWEPLEGMLVSVTGARVVAPTNLFGELSILTRKNARPGSGFFASTKQILLRSLGPGEVDYNPERIMVDDSSLSAPIVARPGDRVRSLTGVVDYTFGNYKLQPAFFDVEIDRIPRGPVSRRSRGDDDDDEDSDERESVAITTFNVENLFESASNVETKLLKLTLAMVRELRLPEILVVQEVENTAVLQELGDRVNAVRKTSYRAVSFDTSDARGIEVGFLFDERRVGLRDAFQLSGPDVDAAFGASSPSPGREPLVGVFDVGGHEVVIVGNHFKSKSGDDPLFGVTIPGTRVTEVQRKAQARVVRDYVNTLLDSDPRALVLVAGDLNDFEFGEPGEGPDHPLAVLEGGPGEVPLTNLILREKAAERFTFLFDGNSQVLDHVLVSPALKKHLTGQDVLHFNASWPSELESDTTTALRSSDHDPVEARFDFDDDDGRRRREGR